MGLEPPKQGEYLTAAFLQQLTDLVNAASELGLSGPNWASGSGGPVAGYAPSSGASVRHFELSSSHAPGGTTAAYIRNWDSSEDDYVTDTSADTFDVVDPLKRFRGRERDEGPASEDDSGGTRGKHGSWGVAVYRHGQWEIEYMQPHALMIYCLVNDASGFADTDATFGVDAIFVIQPTDTALLMADVGASISNARLDWDGDDDAPMYLVWDDQDENWHPVQMKCKA
jgi:hypothetical protein